MLSIALALAAVALLAGAAAATLDALRRGSPWGLGRAFAVYVGLMGATATTWAESMDILPLALVYSAVTGIVPFAVAHGLVRRAFAASRRARPPSDRAP